MSRPHILLHARCPGLTGLGCSDGAAFGLEGTPACRLRRRSAWGRPSASVSSFRPYNPGEGCSCPGEGWAGSPGAVTRPSHPLLKQPKELPP